MGAGKRAKLVARVLLAQLEGLCCGGRAGGLASTAWEPAWESDLLEACLS